MIFEVWRENRCLCAAAAAFALVLPGLAAADDLHACDLVRRSDVAAVLHWTQISRREAAYHLSRTSGRLCTYEAKEGSVVVTLPDFGSSFLQDNALVDPFYNGFGVRVAGRGYAMQLFNDTAYVKKNERSVAVQLLPNEGSPSPDDVIALGKIVARRLP